jgi:hypothetical protein
MAGGAELEELAHELARTDGAAPPESAARASRLLTEEADELGRE